jgi:hypothetical protein
MSKQSGPANDLVGRRVHEAVGESARRRNKPLAVPRVAPGFEAVRARADIEAGVGECSRRGLAWRGAGLEAGADTRPLSSST